MKKKKFIPNRIGVTGSGLVFRKKTESQIALGRLMTMVNEIEARGEKPVEIFSIILTDQKNVGINALNDVTAEYLAVIIDILENSLRQINTQTRVSKI
jgi:hypothetical protein